MVDQATTRLFSQLNPSALQRLRASNFDPSALRRVSTKTNNAVLPKDAWKEIDDTIYKVAREKFQLIEALRGAGVDKDLGGLHVLFDMWQQVSDFGEVRQSMDFQNQGPNDAPNFEQYMIPIPLTHGDWQIGARKLGALENTPNVTVDTAMISQITEHITAKLEDTVINGTDVTLNGDPAPGLITHADSYDATSDAGWTGDWGANPGDIMEDLKHLVSIAKNDNHKTGPYFVFVANEVWDHMNIADPEGTGDRDLLERLNQMAKVREIVEVDQLDDGYVILVDPIENVIQLPYAADLQAVEWETHGGYVTNYKIFTAMAPRVMSDEDGNTGVVYATDA